MSATETLEQVQRAGRERLYPSVTNPSWLVLRARRELFRRWLDGLAGTNPAVLDVGGRIQPYRPLVAGGQVRYVAVDLRSTPLVNVVANAEHLPFAGNLFDLVFCTQMLEYAPDPLRVIAEILRVLKPGGLLLLSVPSLAIRDADEDRWRFWPAAVRELLSGFSEIEIAPDGGSITGFVRTLNAGFHGLAKYQAVRTLLDYTLVPVLNLIGLGLAELVHSRDDTFAVNYSVRARK